MQRFKRLFRSKANRDCEYCQGLQDGGVRIPAADLVRGYVGGCPACQLLYESINPSDLIDPRLNLLHVRLYGDSIICHTFDPGSEAVSTHLRSEEGKT